MSGHYQAPYPASAYTYQSRDLTDGYDDSDDEQRRERPPILASTIPVQSETQLIQPFGRVSGDFRQLREVSIKRHFPNKVLSSPNKRSPYFDRDTIISSRHSISVNKPRSATRNGNNSTNVLVYRPHEYSILRCS